MPITVSGVTMRKASTVHVLVAASCLLAASCGGGGGQDLSGADLPDAAAHDVADVVDDADDAESPDARDAGDAVEPPDSVDPDDASDADSVEPPDAVDDTTDAGPDAPDTKECAAALPLTCGDSFNHSTITQGRANAWSAYNCTARLENGRETVYRFEYENDCLVTITLSNLTTDLDVLALPACNPWTADKCSSTPLDIQDDETIAFLVTGGAPTYVVVDGYDGSEGSYTINASCDCGEPLDDYRSQLAECAFQYVDSRPWNLEVPTMATCLPEPCRDDDDCQAAYDWTEVGRMCVFGNCVYCSQDGDCPESLSCRGGRCNGWEEFECPEIPDCVAAGCGEAEVSETSCPICLCTTEFFNNCAVDEDCQVISHHPFQRCVYGRCAECRVDSDCGHEALQCLPPGMCMSMLTHPSAIYGSWIIGWYGAFNHFSYFRFEHDGTLRRASYDPVGPAGWADDVFLGNCPGAWTDGTPGPLIGTWEPVMTESGFLVISVDFQAVCNPGEPELTRWLVTMDESGDGFTMRSVENPDDSQQLDGVRIDPNIFCDGAFLSCIAPDLALF